MAGPTHAARRSQEKSRSEHLPRGREGAGEASKRRARGAERARVTGARSPSWAAPGSPDARPHLPIRGFLVLAKARRRRRERRRRERLPKWAQPDPRPGAADPAPCASSAQAGAPRASGGVTPPGGWLARLPPGLRSLSDTGCARLGSHCQSHSGCCSGSALGLLLAPSDPPPCLSVPLCCSGSRRCSFPWGAQLSFCALLLATWHTAGRLQLRLWGFLGPLPPSPLTTWGCKFRLSFLCVPRGLQRPVPVVLPTEAKTESLGTGHQAMGTGQQRRRQMKRQPHAD
ncbi:uncharacterized protein LOC122747084 [Dromiciops gliroides]|uniref:uncharacterized protein LOC122747084 n=1 Tax=Dromiciops gliroides TaxID=33562 RepID=UPI001CC6B7AA|nr:uncharacterized protein LOC122747084 [Dromiciops gliroides]